MYYTQQDLRFDLWVDPYGHYFWNIVHNNLDHFSHGNTFLRLHLQNYDFQRKEVSLVNQRFYIQGEGKMWPNLMFYILLIVWFLRDQGGLYKKAGCLVKTGTRWTSFWPPAKKLMTLLVPHTSQLTQVHIYYREQIRENMC